MGVVLCFFSAGVGFVLGALFYSWWIRPDVAGMQRRITDLEDSLRRVSKFSSSNHDIDKYGHGHG